MTRTEFETYLTFVALASGILGVVNLLRPHKRWLGVGSILLGLAALLYRQSFPAVVFGVPIALAVVCIGAQARERERRKAL